MSEQSGDTVPSKKPPESKGIGGKKGACGAARLKAVTPEQKAAGRARAASRKAAMKTDFLDEPTWLELSRVYGIRLPQWSVAPKGNMRKWILRCGITVAQYLEWSADRNLQDFAKLNPTWGMRPLVGNVLEAIDAGYIASTLKRREPRSEELPIEEAPLFDGRRDRRTGDAVPVEAPA